MEFIFELFAEILGRDEKPQSAAAARVAEAEETEAAGAGVLMEEQGQVETQPVNIFNVVNFH